MSPAFDVFQASFFWPDILAVLTKSQEKVNEYSSYATCLTAMVTHVPYGITQCYLTPSRDDTATWYSIQ